MDLRRALTLLESPAGDPLELVRAAEKVKAWADARQLEAIHELAEQEPAGFDPCGQLVDPVPAEVACALTWTAWTASRRVDLAHELHDDLPDVLDALRLGEIDLPKAVEIAHGTCELPPADRGELASRAIGYAASHTRAQLKAWLVGRIAKLNPDAAEKRRKKAKKQRRVWVQPESDGMATLGAYLTAEEAQACLLSLKHGVANHEGSVDGARADLLVQRLTGLAPADPIPVQVIITPGGPELAGHGPLSPLHAAQLCDGAPRINLEVPAPTLSYAPTVALVKYVKARDRHCRFRGCRRAAMHCDLDHTIEHPHGPTCACNLHCLCRYHHRLKTHTAWQVHRNPDGSLTWTSPRGHQYRSELEDP